MYDFLDDPDPVPLPVPDTTRYHTLSSAVADQRALDRALPEGPPIPRAKVREAILSVLRDGSNERLQRTEWEVATMAQVEREGVCEWLGSMLHRPPLEQPSRAWKPMRALVEALWWDLADRTPADPADPDAGNERLVPNHPWGEGSEA